MPLDFTFAAFDVFCQRVSHLPVFTLAGYLSTFPPPAAPFVILRLDVDYREAHAVHLAHIAAGYGVRGSFYFRHRESGFDFAAMRTVAALGHEVGYHFETLDVCRGGFDRAANLFSAHVEQLRAAGLAIRTVAAHGSTPTAPTYRANLDLLSRMPDLLTRTDLFGETTLSVDFAQLVYVSDANWRWRRHVHYTPGGAGLPTTLCAALNELAQPTAIYLNFHPHQWFARPVSMVYYRARNRIGRRVVLFLRAFARAL